MYSYLLHSIPFKHAIHFLACITLDHTHLCIGGTHNNLKLDNDNQIEFCQEYKYLGVTFDTSGTDDTHTHRKYWRFKEILKFNLALRSEKV